ncbi:hypothetical protein H257_08480 [Aphanomyces astaci]|uniref:RING-type domain-containing protein n=1 Tax=Aphanomyces astaci TaxID=112090 RepID=W4GET1_APHAT|nr:hypothetical protein H257_08480 [Aphanomyces astaci]ETV77549.1 hypothetical protein H257_08480 [Aphanomyces astaci]|eukprot:XP_009832659.1 hypothetical protein H257_08480 [Aphanomyces astaci]
MAAPFTADPAAAAKYAFFSCAAGVVAVASAYEKASLLSFSPDVLLQHLLASKWSLLVLLNVFGLVLVRLFQAIVHRTLGSLAPNEWKYVRESAFSFVLLRCILLFNAIDWTVLDSRPLLHLVLWMALLTIVHTLFTALRRRLDTIGATSLQIVRTTLLVLLVSLGLTARLSLYVFSFPSVLCIIALSECALLSVQWLQLGLQLFLAHTANRSHDAITAAAIASDERKASLATVSHMALDVVSLVATSCQYAWLRTLDSDTMFRVSFLDFVLMLHARQAVTGIQRQYHQWARLHQILAACDSTYECVRKLLENDKHSDQSHGRSFATVLHSTDADVHCVICLHRLTLAMQLPCGHTFHRHCLRQCLQTVQASPHKCAVCRHPIAIIAKTSFSGDDDSLTDAPSSFLWPVQSHRHSRAS